MVRLAGTNLITESEGELRLYFLDLKPEPSFHELFRVKSPGSHSYGGPDEDNQPEDLCYQAAFWAPDDAAVLLHFLTKTGSLTETGIRFVITEVSTAEQCNGALMSAKCCACNGRPE